MNPTPHEQKQSVDRQQTQSVQSQPSAVPPSPPQQASDSSVSSIASTKDLASAQPPPQASSMPHIADDTDLIEKEWVDKAKEIVAQTTNDPYLQNQEINKIRADYLKKRYNKEIKQSE